MTNNALSIKIRHLLPLVFLLASCGQYLALKPAANVAIPASLDDVELLLNNSQFLNFSSASLGNGNTDDFYLADETYLATDERERAAYRWGWQTYNFPNEWNTTYQAINITNLSLETLEKVGRGNGEVARWDHLKGTALVYRAFHLLNALWTYAQAYDPGTSTSDPGIVLRTSTDINVVSTRSPVADCYQKIIADLTEAVPLIRNTSSLPTLPTKATAYALLARTYLSMRIYEDALHYSGLSLELKGELMDFASDIIIQPGQVPPFDRFNKEVIFTALPTATFWAESSYYVSVDIGLVNLYGQHDLRKHAFFWERPDGTTGFRGMYHNASDQFFTGIATDEMYLIRAECLARTGEVERGIAELNTLLKKRWDNRVPFEGVEASDAATAVDLILMERRKELIGRNLRHIDIKRLNREGRGIGLRRKIENGFAELPANDPRWALPLPSDIIAQTGMPQNIY